MKILIIKTGALGDIIRTTCVLPGITKKYYNVEIHWVVKSPGEELLKGNKYIKKIIMIDQLESADFNYDVVYSTGDEYCSYLKNVNNETITANRIYGSMLDHLKRSRY
jgi:heptosyltransferase II